ncbi:MAG TPA: DMT family transporter, partial [Alphaproteobacteria bacterium]|nr:DMT family transporter [Alphaproteobacteria bacterium]
MFSRLLAPATFIVLWSGAFIAVRAGLPYVSPLTFLASRFAVASLVLLVASLAWRRWRTSWRQAAPLWPHLALSGILINGAYLSAGYLAMTQIKGAMMALVGALAPVVTALISTRLLGERIRPTQWLGFGLGFAGVVLVVGVEPQALELSAGLGWALVSMLCIVAGTLYFNKHCRQAPLVPANCLQLGAAALFCWLLVAAFEQPRVEPSVPALLSFAYLTGAVSLGGMAIYLYMLGRGTAGRVIANLYLTPGVAALIGWLVLGETFSPKAL